jgi:hypothetical protein
MQENQCNFFVCHNLLRVIHNFVLEVKGIDIRLGLHIHSRNKEIPSTNLEILCL